MYQSKLILQSRATEQDLFLFRIFTRQKVTIWSFLQMEANLTTNNDHQTLTDNDTESPDTKSPCLVLVRPDRQTLDSLFYRIPARIRTADRIETDKIRTDRHSAENTGRIRIPDSTTDRTKTRQGHGQYCPPTSVCNVLIEESMTVGDILMYISVSKPRTNFKYSFPVRLNHFLIGVFGIRKFKP